MQLWIIRFQLTKKKCFKIQIKSALSLSGVPPYNNNYKLDPQDNLVFFHDDDGHDVAGTVYRIHVWNKDLTDDVVLSTCNCILPASDKACKANLVHIPAYSKLEYSSTYGNYQVKLVIFC